MVERIKKDILLLNSSPLTLHASRFKKLDCFATARNDVKKRRGCTPQDHNKKIIRVKRLFSNEPFALHVKLLTAV